MNDIKNTTTIVLARETVRESLTKDGVTYSLALALAALNHAVLGWHSVLLDLFLFVLALGLCDKLTGRVRTIRYTDARKLYADLGAALRGDRNAQLLRDTVGAQHDQ